MINKIVLVLYRRLMHLYPQLLVGLWLLLSLVGCSQPRSAADEQALRDAEATITALSTENARLATQVAAPAPNVASTVVTTTVITAPAVVTAAVTAPVNAATGPAFPAVVAEIPLAPDQEALLDFRLDQAANRIYVTDAAQLYVLDAANYQLLATLPVGGRLTLDAAAARLFVAPALSTQEPGGITVVDTQRLTVTGIITGASHLALDLEHQRIFVGHEQRALNEQLGAPVQALDAATLAPLAESPHYGIPVYNPQRNELLLVNASVWVIDPATWALKQDLLPEILRQECIDCNGALIATDARLFPAADVLALALWRRTSSGGPGIVPAPHFLNATTLEPLNDPALTLQPTCGSQPLLRPVANGRSYTFLHFMRYVAHDNLLVKDSAGSLITWRDGIGDPFVNVNTDQAYVDDLVLDLASLTPLGELPITCLFAHDLEQGLLYGARQNRFVVLAERGGGRPTVRANQDAILPAQPIHQILPSPTFAQDNQLFVISGAASHELYRSTDGGQTWLRLRQGLPGVDGATLTIVLSPAFATDRTLFLGGYTSAGRGLGVFRSSDGGDSWQVMWQGLTHLRVDDVVVSPNYAQDQTVLVFAVYDWLTPPFTNGHSVHRSTTGGLAWTLVATTTTDVRPDLPALLPTATPAPTLPVRLSATGQTLERTLDNGQTWKALDLQPPVDNRFVDLVPTGDNQIVYLLGSHDLWRVRDQGATVESWTDERVQGLTLTNTLTTLALSDQRLFVGTFAGKVWVLDPVQMNWVVVAEASREPAPVVPTVPITPTALSPTRTLTTGEPPAGLYEPQGVFASDWARNPARQQTLGWAKTAEAASTTAAQQMFEKGLMIWRGDEQAHYVLYGDNTWQRFPDTFQEGERESDPALVAPGGKLQPIRGFGKIWREQNGVRAGLGWATAKEQGFDAIVQDFEHGVLLRSGGLVYALIEQADGRRVWLVL